MQSSLRIYLLLQLAFLGLVRSASDCEDLPCSHKCVVSLGEARCTCPEDMTLGDDKKTCQAPVSFLLAMFRGIKQLTEKGKDNDIQLAIPVVTRAFDIHFANQDLYASANSSILRYSLKSKNEPPKTVLTLDSSANSLAVDWVRNELYWISTQRSRIEASDLQGNNRRTVLTFEDANTQALPGDPKPTVADWHHLHIDPYVEKLFWVGGGLVYSVDLKGQNLQIGVGGWREVSAISLDPRGQLIYSAAQVGEDHYIGRSRYDGSQPDKFNIPYLKAKVYNLGVLGRTVFWQSSHTTESLFKVQIPASGNMEQAKITVLEDLNQIVYDMKIYHPDIQKTVK